MFEIYLKIFRKKISVDFFLFFLTKKYLIKYKFSTHTDTSFLYKKTQKKMMASPIPDKFWNTMFTVSVTTFSAAMLFSLYRQHSSSHNRFADQWAIVNARRGTKDLRSVAEALRMIHHGAQEERKSRKGTSILAVVANVKGLLQWLTVERGNEDLNTISFIALQLTMFCFTDDRETRTVFANAGGFNHLVKMMSAAVKAEEIRHIDLTAQCLEKLTSVEENELVLPGDVPEGCEGSYHLARSTVLNKLLRTLEPGAARVPFLRNMSGTLANIMLLHAGSTSISKGDNGVRGQDFFFRLFGHADSGIVANAVRAISFLIMHSPEDAHMIASSDNGAEKVRKIIELIDVGRSPAIVMQAMNCLRYLYKSPSKEPFLYAARENGAVAALCSIWVSSSMERPIRNAAEVLVRRFGTEEITSPAVIQALDQFGARIADRKKRDKEEDEKAEEQQKRQAYMQQMMMQQMMGGGGGMPPGMGQMMEDD